MANTLGNIILSDEPLLFKNRVNWNIIKWNVQQWKQLFDFADGDSKMVVREGSHQCSQKPIWERYCTKKRMDANEFFDIFSSSNSTTIKSWLYFDYKPISSCISETSCSKLDFTWSDVGFPELSAKDSTIWIGTTGAHTPCHMDTYGCNFVAQIYGRKRWLLFPPSETENLKAVRVPYEESSVYSSYNFFRGCAEFPAMKDAIMVDLEPGDVLYVPKSWWHYVENLSSAISINTWVPLESDGESRIKESLVKYFVRSMMKDMNKSDVELLLNPNEDDLGTIPLQQVLEELKWCVQQSKPTLPRISTSVKGGVELYKDHCIPRTAMKEIQLKQSVSHKCNIDVGSSNCDISSERLNLIKAFCHPDVIDLVTKKYLQLSSTN